jgi:hypothetical protein
MSDYMPGSADFMTCRLPKIGRLDGGRAARCPDCGQWWRVKFQGSRDWDDCYVEWHHIGWLRLHTRYRAQYKHWKGGGEDADPND